MLARLLNHPLADRHDQPAFFRRRNKAQRRHQAPLRVLPANQGLDADQGAAAQVHLRLVMQQQLSGRHGLAQVVKQVEALQGLLVHAAVEVAPGLPAVLLGLVHGGFGIAQQGLEGTAIARRHRQAKGQRGTDAAPQYGQRLAQMTHDLVGNRRRIFGAVQVRQEDDELVAARPAQGVAVADQAAQHLRQGAQQGIAVGVAKGIVEGLETVDVHVQQGHMLLVTQAGGQCLVGAITQQLEVGQAGEGVVKRQHFDLLLRRLAPADFLGQAPVGFTHTGNKHHAVQQQVGQRFVQVTKQAVDIVHIAVRGKAQLGQDRYRHGQEQAMGVIVRGMRASPPEAPGGDAKQGDHQPLDLDLQRRQALPFDKGRRKRVGMQQLQIKHRRYQHQRRRQPVPAQPRIFQRLPRTQRHPQQAHGRHQPRGQPEVDGFFRAGRGDEIRHAAIGQQVADVEQAHGEKTAGQQHQIAGAVAAVAVPGHAEQQQRHNHGKQLGDAVQPGGEQAAALLQLRRLGQPPDRQQQRTQRQQQGQEELVPATGTAVQGSGAAVLIVHDASTLERRKARPAPAPGPAISSQPYTDRARTQWPLRPRSAPRLAGR